MDLPTYTSIWRIEKRLYKLYDFRLPMPLPVGQIAVFAAVTVPYVILLTLFGLPFDHTLFWLYVLPPGVLTWLATRPVLESKRLPELIISQVRYLGEPKTWCRLAPLTEADEVHVVARVWRRSAVPVADVAAEPALPPLPEAERGLPEAQRALPEAQRALPGAQRGRLEGQRALWERRRELPQSQRGLPEGERAQPGAQPAQPEATRGLPEGEEAQRAQPGAGPAQPGAAPLRRRAVFPLPGPSPLPSSARPAYPPPSPDSHPVAEPAGPAAQPASAAPAAPAAGPAAAERAAAETAASAASPPATGPAGPGAERDAAETAASAASPPATAPAAPAPGPVQVPAPRPVRIVSAGAAPVRPARQVERALGGPADQRSTSWRDHVTVVPGGRGPGQPDQVQRERLRAAAELDGPRQVVVLGCTVGAGQTVTALMLADLLAELRSEPVAALDLNPGPASLAVQAQTPPAVVVSALLAGRDAGRPAGHFGSRGRGRLDVIAQDIPADGARPVGDLDHRRLFGLLASRYPLVITDPGAAAVARVLTSADQLVLVAPASPDASRATAMTLEWLDANGYATLIGGSVAVMNGVSKRSAVHAEQAETVVRGRCRAIVRVPWDDHLGEPPAERGLRGLQAGPGSRLSQLRPQVLDAYTALAGVVVSGLAAAAASGRAAP